MLIGELAKATGVSPKTIRYYETLGLLKPARRTRGNYRVYGESAIPMLQFIRHAERLGFSLKDIRQVLRVWRRKGVICGIVRQIAQQKLETGGRSLAGTDGIAGTIAAVDRGTD